MAYVSFSFETAAFKDGDAVRREDQIPGFELATWLANELSTAGFKVSNVYDEDHGWDFDVTSEGKRQHVACCNDENGSGVGFVTIGSRVTKEHEVVKAIQSLLANHTDIHNLEASFRS